MPENAVIGGTDRYGNLYVARAKHNSHGVVAGKFSEAQGRAYIPNYSKEHIKNKDIEVA